VPFGDLAGDAAFGLLMEGHWQTLAREVAFTLGDSEGQP